MKPGDLITLSISPTFQYADFRYLKPSASITRALGESPEESLAEMESDLRKLVMRSLSLEISVLADLDSALREGGTDGVVDYCTNQQEGKPHGSEIQSASIARTETSTKPVRRRASA